MLFGIGRLVANGRLLGHNVGQRVHALLIVFLPL